MKIIIFLVGVTLFLSGFSISFIVQEIYNSNIEIPFSEKLNLGVFAPSDSVKEKDIMVFEDRVVIYIEDSSVSNYLDSGSMLPVLNEGSNGIRIKPLSEEDISIGDIISFNSDKGLIVHRVLEKGIDREGVYFIAGGDNNEYVDGKIRFKNIEYKTIAIIY